MYVTPEGNVAEDLCVLLHEHFTAQPFEDCSGKAGGQCRAFDSFDSPRKLKKHPNLEMPKNTHKPLKSATSPQAYRRAANPEAERS